MAESNIALHPKSEVSASFLLKKNLAEIDQIEGIVIIRILKNGNPDVQFSRMDNSKVALASLHLQHALVTR